jgi:hypothetical protein
MIGLVLVTHGGLAAEFITAMEHVVGPQQRIEAICIGPDDDMEGRRNDIAEAIARWDEGAGRDHPHRPVRRHTLEPRDLAEEVRRSWKIAG